MLRERGHMGAEREGTAMWVLRERGHVGAEREGSCGC